MTRIRAAMKRCLAAGLVAKPTVARALEHAAEIDGRHGLERRGLDGEGENAARNAVHFHRIVVVARHELFARLPFHGPGAEERKAVGKADDGPWVATRASGVLHELAQGIDARPAQIIAFSDAVAIGEARPETTRHVLDAYGLETRLRTGKEHERQPALELGESVEKLVLRSEYHRRPEYRHRKLVLRREHPGLAFALGTQVLAGALGVRMQRTHVQQARHAPFVARLHDFLRELDVGAREFRTVRTAWASMQDTDEIHHRVAAGSELDERLRIVHVGLDHVDRRQKNQVLGALAPARGHDHEVLVFGELAHDMPADKAAAADDQYATHGAAGESPSLTAKLASQGWPCPRKRAY